MAEPIYYCTKLIDWPCLTWEQWATFWQAAGTLSATFVAISAVFIAWHFPYRQRVRERDRARMAGAFASVMLAQRIREKLAAINGSNNDHPEFIASFQKAQTEIRSYLPDAQQIGTFGTLSKEMSMLILSFSDDFSITGVEKHEGSESISIEQMRKDVEELIADVIAHCTSLIEAGKSLLLQLEIED